jgi:hypothetical protein
MKFGEWLQERKKRRTQPKFDGIIRRAMPFVVKENDPAGMGQSDISLAAVTAPFLGLSKDRSENDYKKKKRSSKKDKAIIRPVKEDSDTDAPVADKLKDAKPDVVWGDERREKLRKGKKMNKKDKAILKRVEEASYDSPPSLASQDTSRGRPGSLTPTKIAKYQKEGEEAALGTKEKKKKRTIDRVTKGIDVGKWSVYEQVGGAPGGAPVGATTSAAVSGGAMSQKDVVGLPRDMGRDALKKRKKKRQRLTLSNYSSKI